jgi:hypothetical protein
MVRAMSPQSLTQALHAMLLDRDRMLAYAGGDHSVLPDGLDEAERAALVSHDLADLYRLGAHPLVVFHLSAILYPRSHYIRNVVPKIQTAANPFYDYYADRRDSRGSPAPAPSGGRG